MPDSIIKFFIKDADNTSSNVVRKRYGNFSSAVGIFCNLMLFILKMLIGLISGSIAITADAFNNLSDVGSNAVTFFGFKLAAQPPDDDHPFGHGRFEYLAGLLIAIFVVLVGIEVIKTSISKIISPEPITFSWFIVIALVLSMGVKFWMSAFYLKLGNKIDSTALFAASADSKSDCISTAATTFGIVISYLFSWNIDGYLGILAGLFILYSGYKITMDTISPLLGNVPDGQLVLRIRSILMSCPVAQGVHDLIIHDYGPGRMMGSVHMEVPADSDILVAHDAIDNIEREVLEQTGVAFVVHMDPIALDCEKTERYKSIVADVLLAINSDLTFHDFRMVDGDTHINLIFDVVLPHGFNMSGAEVKKIIDSALRATGETLFSVITFDHNYI